MTPIGHSPSQDDERFGDGKRRRLVNGVAKVQSHRNDCVFAPFRTIGLVSPTAVPFTSTALGKTTFQITTSTGRSLQTYDLRKGLSLVFVTRPQTPDLITASLAWKDKVLAAWGGLSKDKALGVWIFRRGRLEAQVDIPKNPDHRLCPILKLEVFGAWILACTQTQVYVWDSVSLQHHATYTACQGKDVLENGLSGAFCCMPTFLNKILLGRRDGRVELVNVKTAKLIHTFAPPGSETDAVSALQPSPALGIAAIAHESGLIRLLNIESGNEVLQFHSDTTHGTINSISFRTDGLGAGKDGMEDGIMAVSHRNSGNAIIFDLNRGGRVKDILRGAHTPALQSGECGGISKLEFLPGQNIMVTSGMDNTLRTWIFDSGALSSLPRVLHVRGGHAGPITSLQFVPSNSDGAETQGKWLLSGGQDRAMWAWSLRRDAQSTELSQGAMRKKAKIYGLLDDEALRSTSGSNSLEELKASPITSIACCLNRDGGMGAAAGAGSPWTNNAKTRGKSDTASTSMTGWESVVTAHKGDCRARTWFWGRKRAGRWTFETADRTEVTAVAISPCGSFALVGSAAGSLSMFNLQSGMQRQKFPSPITPSQAKRQQVKSKAEQDPTLTLAGHGKHQKAITGIVVNASNQVIVSCGLDGKIKFWSFQTGRLQHEIDWSRTAQILFLRSHAQNDLIGLGCSDLCIRIVDSETRKCVRELWGATGQLTDFTFSHDARWVVAAGLDRALRVWDVPTGHLINAIRLENPCIALAFSDSGEYLATAHANSMGINLWNNRTLFVRVPTRLIQDDEVISIAAPLSSGEGGQALTDLAYESKDQNSALDAQQDQDEDLDTDDAVKDETTAMKQLDSSLLSLSLVPKSRWRNIMHLDAIRARGKPRLPPKKPQQAPFFLPALHDQPVEPQRALLSLHPTTKHMPQAILPQQDNAPSDNQRSRVGQSSTHDFSSLSVSQLSSKLETCSEHGDYDSYIDSFCTLSPGAADLEIRSLTLPEMVLFVQALSHRLRQRRDFELVQAWMNVFLKLHSAAIVARSGNEDADSEGRQTDMNMLLADDVSDVDAASQIDDNTRLREALQEWRMLATAEQRRLNDLLGYCSGVLSFLRNT